MRVLHFAEVLNTTQNFFNRNGDLSQVWMGTQLYVMVNNPVNVEKILNSQSCLERGKQYSVLKHLLNRGLITIESMWKILFNI